jgi:outer membrane protein assembly factor BamB
MKPIFTVYQTFALFFLGLSASCNFIVNVPSSKSIISFSIVDPPAAGTIDPATRSIILNLPNATDLSALVAKFSTTGERVMVGATLQQSGITANNFSTPVLYRVTATNGTSAEYRVTASYSPIRACWARSTASAPDYSQFKACATDEKGNVYAVGYIYTSGIFDFGNSINASGGSSTFNGVLVKYAPNGTVQWARTTTSGSGSSRFEAVVIDSDGNIYVAGTASNTVSFGNSVTTKGVFSAGENALLVKYDSSGTAQWAQTPSIAPNVSNFSSLALDPHGDILVAGSITGSGHFELGTMASTTGTFSGGWNALVVKYDSTGTALWARSPASGSNVSTFYSVCVSPNGNVFVGGMMAGTVPFDFGNSVSISGLYSNKNCILVKYNTSGITRWAKTVSSGTSNSWFNDLAIDPRENIYVGGMIDQGIFDFGNSLIVKGLSWSNSLLVKYDPSGSAQWAHTVVTGTNASAFTSLVLNSEGNIYVVGDIRGTEDYDFGDSIKVKGTYNDLNMLILKYDSFGRVLWARSLESGLNDSSFRSLSVNKRGEIYAVGEIRGSSLFSFMDSVTVTGAYAANLNPILVKYY